MAINSKFVKEFICHDDSDVLRRGLSLILDGTVGDVSDVESLLAMAEVFTGTTPLASSPPRGVPTPPNKRRKTRTGDPANHSFDDPAGSARDPIVRPLAGEPTFTTGLRLPVPLINHIFIPPVVFVRRELQTRAGVVGATFRNTNPDYKDFCDVSRVLYFVSDADPVSSGAASF